MTACAVPSSTFPVAEISIGGTRLTVWEADDGVERSQGLRRVEALPPGIDGMLFVYARPTEAVFVMEDTLIPLDLWFFDPEGRLMARVEMTPCQAPPCPRHHAPGAVSWALETPAGRFRFPPGAVLDTSP